MIKLIQRNGAFVSVTTRRANFSNLHFGKITFWPSRKAYDDGSCAGAVTYVNVFLGHSYSWLETEANIFIDKTLPNYKAFLLQKKGVACELQA